MTQYRFSFSVSIRSMFVATLLVAIGVGWVTNYYRNRISALYAIERAGGKIQASSNESALLKSLLGTAGSANIDCINLRDCKVDEELLRHVAVIGELNRLWLPIGIDDDGIRQISHLQLQELNLPATRITDKSAITLSKIKSLNQLDLGFTSISDDFLEKLEALPNLQSLVLRDTRVTSAGMEYLSRHPKLATLDLRRTEVDDSGVQVLISLPTLANLSLSLSKATNHSFEHLNKFPKLKRLGQTANGLVTTEAIKSFVESHPNCVVEAEFVIR